ncbi:hypothetical protein ACV22V_10790 [Burkholderia sp. AW33-5]
MLSAKNEGFHIDSGVIVEMTATGKLAVSGTDWPFKSGPPGMLARPHAAHGMRIASPA